MDFQDQELNHDLLSHKWTERDNIYKHIYIKIHCKITDFIKCKSELIASYLTTFIATCSLRVSSIRKETTP